MLRVAKQKKIEKLITRGNRYSCICIKIRGWLFIYVSETGMSVFIFIYLLFFFLLFNIINFNLPPCYLPALYTHLFSHGVEINSKLYSRKR